MVQDFGLPQPDMAQKKSSVPNEIQEEIDNFCYGQDEDAEDPFSKMNEKQLEVSKDIVNAVEWPP